MLAWILTAGAYPLNTYALMHLQIWNLLLSDVFPERSVTCDGGCERNAVGGQQRASGQWDAHGVVGKRPHQVLPNFGQRRPTQPQRIHHLRVFGSDRGLSGQGLE